MLEIRTLGRLYCALMDERRAWQQRIHAQLFHQGTVNLSNRRAIFAGSPPRFTRSRVTYEAYVVSRTSTPPQVDSAVDAPDPSGVLWRAHHGVYAFTEDAAAKHPYEDWAAQWLALPRS